MDSEDGEDAPSLRRLAALRQGRPDYRRVISAEFCQQERPHAGSSGSCDGKESLVGSEDVPIRPQEIDTGSEFTNTTSYSIPPWHKATRRDLFQQLPFYDSDTVVDSSASHLEFFPNQPVHASSAERDFRLRADLRLRDMCLEVLCHSRHTRGRHLDLPFAVRKQLSAHARTLRLRAVRFRWVRRVLHLVERTHRVWDLDFVLRPRELWEQYDHRGDDRPIFTGVQTGGLHQQIPVTPLIAMTLAVDWMLPSHLDENLQGRLVSEITVHEALVKHIRKKLKTRYPTLTEKLFDLALPYVWWRRGFYARARDAFVSLAQTLQSTVEEADLMVREAGRMYVEAGWVTEACRLFYLSLERQGLQHRHVVAAFCARAFCSGELTPSKFASAQAEGDIAFQTNTLVPGSDIRHDQGLQAAVENQLCFFAGLASDEREGWLQELRKRLRVAVSDAGQLNYHLSFVEAMLKNSERAASRYESFESFGYQAFRMGVGRQFDTDSNTQYNPWMPLIVALELQSGGIKPLRMRWRTPISHPNLLKYEAERDGQSCTGPNLRMDGGHLVADICTYLPFRAFLALDPHTGQIINSKCHEVPWMADRKGQDNGFLLDGGSPRLVQIFEDIQGAHVELGHSYISIDKGQLCDPMVKAYLRPPNDTLLQADIYRTDSKGFVQKLDLYKLARDAHLKETQSEIKAHLVAGHIDASTKNQLDKNLSKRYADNLVFNYQILLSLHMMETDPNEGTKKKKLKKKVAARRRVPPLPEARTAYLLHLWHMYTFGHTAVVTFNIGFMRPHPKDEKRYVNSLLILFVNCETAESFLHPKIHIYEMSGGVDHTLTTVTSEWHFPLASHWVIKNQTSKVTERSWLKPYTIHVYDKDGEEVTSSVISDTEPWVWSSSHSVGGRLYSHQDNVVYCADNGHVEQTTLLPADQDVQQCLFRDQKAFLRTNLGFCVLHLPSLDQCGLFVTAPRHSLSQLTDGDVMIYGQYSSLAVLTSQKVPPNATRGIIKDDVTRYVIALTNHLLILEVDDSSIVASIIFHEPLSGQAHEAYLISESRGLLVSASLHESRSDAYYREIVYHYSYQGALLAVLPFLGPGPKSFTSCTFAKRDIDADADEVESVTRVFFLDGHEAIACIDLC